jgi:hypothetical protein
MKTMLHCAILAALVLMRPAFAAEPSAAPEITFTSPVSTTDPERMILEIDLRVLLQHYEKVKTELNETKLKLALVEGGALDLESAEAKQEFLVKKSYKGATREELEEIDQKHDRSLLKEQEKMKARVEVLENVAATTRKQAAALAEDLAKRTTGEPKPGVTPGPRS